MTKYWRLRLQIIRKNLLKFTLISSFFITIIAAICILFPDASHQPLQSLEILDLRDNKMPLTASLTLQNTGWLPITVNNIKLNREGIWSEVTGSGWLKEITATLDPNLKPYSIDYLPLDNALNPGQTADLILTFLPGTTRETQYLELHYYNALRIPYTLKLSLQNDDIFSSTQIIP